MFRILFGGIILAKLQESEIADALRDLDIDADADARVRLTERIREINDEIAFARAREDERTIEAQAARDAKEAQKKYLKNLSSALGSIWKFLESAENDHTPIFNELTSELLGRYLSSHAFNRVTSQSLEPSDRERDLRPSIRDSEYAGIEQAAMHLRQSASRKHGAIALGVLLETIRDRLDRQLRLMKMNKGGNPGNVYRRYSILELARAYREATGKHPTATATGSFVSLCDAVFPILKITCHGLDKAVENTLSKRRSPKTPRSFA